MVSTAALLRADGMGARGFQIAFAGRVNNRTANIPNSGRQLWEILSLDVFIVLLMASPRAYERAIAGWVALYCCMTGTAKEGEAPSVACFKSEKGASAVCCLLWIGILSAI